MPKRVYLHIGWEKTGTSAIQVFCARNQDWLNERGMHYPLMGTLPQHVDLYDDLQMGYASRIRHSYDAVRAEIDRCEHETMIFSHESLHTCSPAIFAQIFQGCEVQIIAYIRRPDTAIISFFVTMARFGLISVHDMFHAVRKFAQDHAGRFEYYWALTGFASQFGRDHITVRHYQPDELIGGQTVSDFMHLLGIDDLTQSKWPKDQPNRSLDADQFAIVLQFAHSIRAMPESRVRRLTCQLSDAMILHTPPDNARRVERFVPVSLRRRLLAFWQDSFRALYDEYFDGRAVFESELCMQDNEPYRGMTPQRLDELADVVRHANVLPAQQSDQFLGSLHQMQRSIPMPRPL